MGSKRKNLLSKCQGNVLEVCCGTGRNLGFYPMHSIQSLYMTDNSESMLNQSLKKNSDSKIHFNVANVTSLHYPNESFDTVVDTFGLCSVSDPIQALKEMSRVLKPNGTILLLEHGRTSNDLLNTCLDKSAPFHAQKWGCWWNRDLNHLIHEAGLEIKSQKTFHFGTTKEFHLVKL